MEIEVQEQGDAVVISLIGEIIARTEQAAMSDLITGKLAEGTRLFVLDLSEVPYVSSLGIAVLVTAHVKISKAGGKLRLVNPRPRVAQVLEMTKVIDIFEPYTSVEEALAAE